MEPGDEIGVFGPDDLDGLEAFYRQYGFALLRGILDGPTVAQLIAEGEDAQRRIVAGELMERYGSTRLGDDAAGAPSLPSYVTHLTEISPTADAALAHPVILSALDRWLGAATWSARDDQFGFVYQDARPGPGSGYSRIGWHSDWQSSPHLDMWPATAVTLHLDATSPANGFLRVVPGSHRWATPAPFDNANGVEVPAGAAATGGYGDEVPPVAMPLGFVKVPGEVALYAGAGDVLFHDGYLWHSAARGTVDGSIRRHIRGSWFSGAVPLQLTPDDFVKNAAR